MDEVTSNVIGLALAAVQDGRDDDDSVLLLLELLTRFRKSTRGYDLETSDAWMRTAFPQYVEVRLTRADVAEVIRRVEICLHELGHPTPALAMIASATEDEMTVPLLAELLARYGLGVPVDMEVEVTAVMAALWAADPRAAEPALAGYLSRDDEIGLYAMHLVETAR